MFMDEDECFERHELIDQMANALLLPPPPVQLAEFEYKEDDLFLWSFDNGALLSHSYNKQSSISDCDFTVEEEKEDKQQQKLLYLMGIPIRKEQVAELNLLDALMHKENVAAAENKGEQAGHVLSMKVINSSTHNEPESFKVGQRSPLPPHGLENKGNASQQLPHLQWLFKDHNEQDEHALDVEQSNSDINSDDETASAGRNSKRKPYGAEIIHYELEEVKCIEPHSFTSQPNRYKENLEDQRITVGIHHSSPELTLENAINHNQQMVGVEKVFELVEELLVEDFGYSTSNEDSGDATTTASQPFSFQTMKSRPQQEVQDETMALDTSAQQLTLLEDVIKIKNKGINMGIEKDDKTIQYASKTCIDDTSEREKQSGKDISLASLGEHFGKPLDDAAKSFGVSRSTFKRVCRGLGIKRWQYGKRRMSSHSSPNLRRVNDDEPSIKNFSCLGMKPLQYRAVAHTIQDMNKIDVKATYNGVSIRFELLDSSGMADLEDNVIKRLKMERDTFSIKYEDDEGDWVLISCDKDVQKCIEISRSMSKSTVKMLVDPPISYKL